MAAKKPNRKPKVLTLGDVAPRVTYHQPGEIPLANATDRFALLDWENILEAIVGKRIVAVSCEPSEVDTVLRHIYQHYHDQDEGVCVPMGSRYDPSTGRLFLYSLLRDWTKVRRTNGKTRQLRTDGSRPGGTNAARDRTLREGS
jgi:hypothetical protein